MSLPLRGRSSLHPDRPHAALSKDSAVLSASGSLPCILPRFPQMEPVLSHPPDMGLDLPPCPHTHWAPTLPHSSVACSPAVEGEQLKNKCLFAQIAGRAGEHRGGARVTGE